MKKFIFNNIKYITLACVALASALVWIYSPLSEYADTESLKGFLEGLRDNPFAFIWIVILYIAAALVFFPVTVLSGAVILLYGGIAGFIYATIGSVIGACTGYLIGRWIGLEKLKNHVPGVDKTMNAVRESGVIGMTVIRMIPIAPFSVVNMVLGAISVPLSSFILGTILGMSPGKVVLAIFGDNIISVFTQPTFKKTIVAIVGLGIWICVVLICNRLARKWQESREKSSD